MMESSSLNNGVDVSAPKIDAPDAHLERASAKPNTKKTVSQPSLRPPTLMIDLLFGALMLFAFQMGDPSAVKIAAKDFDIPTTNKKAPHKETKLLVLKPLKLSGSEWMYETPDGKTITAMEVSKIANSQNSKPIFLMSHDTSVQNYIDAEQPLRRLGMKPALTVAQHEEVKK